MDGIFSCPSFPSCTWNALVGEAVLPNTYPHAEPLSHSRIACAYFVTSTSSRGCLFSQPQHAAISRWSARILPRLQRPENLCVGDSRQSFPRDTLGSDLPRVLADYKRHTARRILKLLEQEGCEWLSNQFEYFRAKHKAESRHQVWQEGSHPQEIGSDEMMQQKSIIFTITRPNVAWSQGQSTGGIRRRMSGWWG